MGMAVAPIDQHLLDPAFFARQRRVRRRWRVAATGLVVLLLAAPVVFTVAQLTDPHRPGTAHRVDVPVAVCDRPGSLWLGERTWVSHDRLPAGWREARPEARGSISGTLLVNAPDVATFTADRGGVVHYRRLSPGALDDLSCPIH